MMLYERLITEETFVSAEVVDYNFAIPKNFADALFSVLSLFCFTVLKTVF